MAARRPQLTGLAGASRGGDAVAPKIRQAGDLPSSQLKSSSDPPIAVTASDADSASGGSYIDGFNIPCAAVASF